MEGRERREKREKENGDRRQEIGDRRQEGRREKGGVRTMIRSGVKRMQPKHHKRNNRKKS
jgi:hypothetical protein